MSSSRLACRSDLGYSSVYFLRLSSSRLSRLRVATGVKQVESIDVFLKHLELPRVKSLNIVGRLDAFGRRTRVGVLATLGASVVLVTFAALGTFAAAPTFASLVTLATTRTLVLAVSLSCLPRANFEIAVVLEMRTSTKMVIGVRVFAKDTEPTWSLDTEWPSDPKMRTVAARAVFRSFASATVLRVRLRRRAVC